MYNIYQNLRFGNETMTFPVLCPNSSKRRAGDKAHKDNHWNKIEHGKYTCSECGCKMTVRASIEFKEEEVK
jgi:hypothetical protein